MRISEEEIYERIRIELEIQLEFYDEDEGIFELYIADIIMEFLSNNEINPFGLSAFRQQNNKKHAIKSIFEPCFPDLHICLFECFFFLYHCKMFEFKPIETMIEHIQIKLNIENWIDYKCYMVNFLYSIDIIPELKEGFIKGDVRVKKRIYYLFFL